MRKSLTLVLALLLVTAAAGIGFSAKKSSPSIVKGKVTAVDTTASTVTVSIKKADTVFTTDAATKFKGVKDLTEVKVGDFIKITYKESDNSNKIVLKIDDMPAKPKK